MASSSWNSCLGLRSQAPTQAAQESIPAPGQILALVSEGARQQISEVQALSPWLWAPLAFPFLMLSFFVHSSLTETGNRQSRNACSPQFLSLALWHNLSGPLSPWGLQGWAQELLPPVGTPAPFLLLLDGPSSQTASSQEPSPGADRDGSLGQIQTVQF